MVQSLLTAFAWRFHSLRFRKAATLYVLENRNNVRCGDGQAVDGDYRVTLLLRDRTLPLVRTGHSNIIETSSFGWIPRGQQGCSSSPNSYLRHIVPFVSPRIIGFYNILALALYAPVMIILPARYAHKFRRVTLCSTLGRSAQLLRRRTKLVGSPTKARAYP